MKFASLTPILLAMAIPLGACAAEEDSVDHQLLTEYRKAIPSRARLSAPSPKATTATLNGAPAEYPTSSWGLVEGINGAVTNMIDTMDAITALPPTFYDSNTLEFVWGPWPADDGIGYVAAYIKDNGTSEDFRYGFALLRGAGNDLASLTPVIWGGATPDASNEDRGVGVTLWDFEADRAFRMANDPSYDASVGDRGRFVALWGAGPDEDNPANEMAFVVAVFRDFVSADEPGNEPVDLDYFYGHYVSPDHTIDFIDYETAFDIDEPGDGTAENIGVRMAFLDEGTGRAEADAAGGSMSSTESAAVVECWDTSINQTYISYELTDAGSVIDSASEGDSTDCGLFEASLDALKVPSLQDVDAGLMAALDDAASNGL